MKKVLMLLDYYHVGGIENICQNIKKYVKNYNIDILCFNSKNNNEVITLSKNESRNFLIRNITTLNKFRQYIKNNSYDIMHIHCYNSFGLIYAMIAKKYIKKVIVHGHNSNIDNDPLKIKYIINETIKIFFSSNSYIYIAPTPEVAKFCFKQKNVHIIPNAIDYSLYTFNMEEKIKYRKQFNIKDDEIVIGHIGRFEKQKNHEFIIEIFKKIVNKKNNYKLILVGEGTLLEKMKEKVELLNLQNKVIFLSYRNDIPKFINIFDVFLFPSLYEGLAITILENQINGKDVFVSNTISKLVEISNKIYFLPLEETPSFWAEKIINIEPKPLKLKNTLKLEFYIYIKKIQEIYDKKKEV